MYSATLLFPSAAGFPRSVNEMNDSTCTANAVQLAYRLTLPVRHQLWFCVA